MPFLMHAVDHPHQHDDAEIGVVPGVDQQRLQRRRLVALRRRQAVDDRLQHDVDAEAGLGRDRHRVGGVEADHVLDLLPDALGLGGGQVDLVQHRHDLVVGVERLIDVGERLRLDALAGVDHQQRALAGGQRARDLIGEVDVAGRVHQVEDVGLAVVGLVVEPDGLRLDGDAALALDIHGIEHLLVHLPRRRPPRSSWISRSASVDLPWSIWATMAKLRMFAMGWVVMRARDSRMGGEGNRQADYTRTMAGCEPRGIDESAVAYLRTGTSLKLKLPLREDALSGSQIIDGWGRGKIDDC